VKVDPKKEFFTTGDVAKILGLSGHDQARYWLKREGALRKRGSRYYTTRALLMSAFPEVFQALAR
jgi:hypothetical protein